MASWDGITGSRTHGTLVVEVHTPAAIAQAEQLNETVERVMKGLEAHGISRIHPGFDLLSIRGGDIDRLIELKSSGVDARVQAMSWNEWKERVTQRPSGEVLAVPGRQPTCRP